MTELPLDFENILAYAIPGLIVLAGVAWLNPPLRHWFGRLHSEHAGSALVGIAALTLVLGMLLGCLRSAVLSPTRKLDLQWGYHSDSFAPMQGDAEPVNYGKLVDEGHLGALREAKLSERATYQFFGNTLVAIMILTILRITYLYRGAAQGRIPRRSQVKGVIGAILFLCLAVILLYPSYRIRYFRYNDAVKAINAA
jgi:hypothetical protein